ncbi:hypothetical protein HMPREF9999_01846 [Alloprevotella sp. oral taxon 473 str. F0040]|nr:hypothetical protein HMPREF9999_01846 [Alloprevotella sp. oral taxon 473 str. F0040]
MSYVRHFEDYLGRFQKTLGFSGAFLGVYPLKKGEIFFGIYG